MEEDDEGPVPDQVGEASSSNEPKKRFEVKKVRREQPLLLEAHPLKIFSGTP